MEVDDTASPDAKGESLSALHSPSETRGQADNSPVKKHHHHKGKKLHKSHKGKKLHKSHKGHEEH